MAIRQTSKIPQLDKHFLKKFSNVYLCDRLINDWVDTAIIVSNLNKIITVDTSLVHLAGSMNKKTYLMTPVVPDWRWGLEKTQDWYPSIRLVRQEKIGCWIQPIQKMKKLLNSKI